MGIKEFIQTEFLLPRMKKGVLVVYDPDRRYRDLCLEMKSDKRIVVDASESSIESREAALDGLKKLGEINSKLEGMLVYVPVRKPVDEVRMADPFSLYEACGEVFPSTDGDEYMDICLKFKPDHSTEIRKVFANNPSPSFSTIDAIGAGADWPQLRSTLKAESTRDILLALLAPTDEQRKDLKDQTGWLQECRDLLNASIGLDLKTKGRTLEPISDELWRFLLFSEFVYDLPGDLPSALSNVPRAPAEAKPIVDFLCDHLRSHDRTRPRYIDKAEEVESELNLKNLCSEIDDLGEKDTFSFEERTFLNRAIEGLINDDPDKTRRYLDRHKHSVWRNNPENQAQWDLIQSALNLIETCRQGESSFSENSRTQATLIDYYTGYLREVDRMHREFEQVVGEMVDPYSLMENVIRLGRKTYRRLAEKAQVIFVKHLESNGWPPAGRLSNADVYDRFVGERLKDRGRKVAYFMVDALRYELGVALQIEIANDASVELHPAYAQLPTITPVGMAGLLPGAKSDLYLDFEKDALVPKLAGSTVANVSQRMDAIRKLLGDRFEEMKLVDLIKAKPKIKPTVELLVIRSTEIDSLLENNPEMTIPLVKDSLNKIRAALHKLRGLGFHEAVIATDHGFFLNAQAQAGDVCKKPVGNWLFKAHDRMLFGEGESDSGNLVVGLDKVGIRGAFSKCAIPKSIAPYSDGHLYFHGGASLQEALVPVLVVKMDPVVTTEKHSVKVELSYKHGAKKITTRLPVIEIVLYTEDLFTQELEILIEAHDDKSEVIGEPRPGPEVNAATRTITLKPKEPVQVIMKMSSEFEGKFIIKALDPKTLTEFSSLKLETDYLA